MTICRCIIVLVFLVYAARERSIAQSRDKISLYTVLLHQDSLLFNRGFNQCELWQFDSLLSEDFEFYHDEAGITGSKADFIAGVRDGLCRMDYKARRVLVAGSLAVYPLQKGDSLYGAIQTGSHSFYAVARDGKERLTSTAQFTHVWLLESGSWKLSRGLSYDHKSLTGTK